MRISRRLLGAIVALGVSLFSPAGLSAQGVTTGAIGGLVVDDAGTPVDAAQIEVINRSTGFSSAGLTRSNGRYLISGLEVGSNYAVTVRRIGNEPQTRERISVSLGNITEVNFSLVRQATVIGTVEILGDVAGDFAPTRTGVATTVSDSALRRLPTLNRNFTDFVALTPQIATTQNGGLSGGGVNNRYNAIQIDGVSESDLFGLGSTGQPGGQARGKSISIEAVKEYQVLLTPFDIRQGNFSGALINAVTKSGTNEFEGTAFYYTRSDKLARDVPYLPAYDRDQYGFSLGGPIVKNRVHFFLAPEWQVEEAPNSGQFLGQSTGFVGNPTVIQAFRDAVQARGIEAGSTGILQKKNPLQNVFGRLDFALPLASRLVLRHNYGYAEDDVFSRSSTSSFLLTSNAYFFQSAKNSTAAQLFTNFSNGAYNELQFNYTTIRDRRTPRVASPQLVVRDQTTNNQLLIAGADRFSMGNELDQDIIEIREDYSQSFGNHQITVGGQAQFFDIRNLFARDSYGIWQFASVDALTAGTPEGYSAGVSLGGPIQVDMDASQYSLYAQDQWQPSTNLALTFGLRMDVPVLSSKPAFTQSVFDAFQRRTDEVPSGNILISPRIGFNLQVPGPDEQQVRGGVGMFAGRPAFVWLSNAYQNSGSGLGLFTCGREGSTTNTSPVPTFSLSGTPPAACGDGVGPSGNLSLVDLIDKDLKFPQTLRATLGYDRRLPMGFVGSIEGLYTRNVNDFFYVNRGIVQQTATDVNGRIMYGTVTQTTAGNPTSGSRVTVARAQAGFNDVIDATNTSKNYSYSFTGQLQRRFTDAFEASASYTFTRARDVQSPTSSQGQSNWRFGRSVGTANQFSEEVGVSLFDVPHKILVSGTYSFRTKTDLSVIYIGNSGVPFEYVYSSFDANADGVNSNDLIYVPTSAENVAAAYRDNASLGGTTYTAQVQADAFEDFIEGSKCLSKQRGQILDRTSCRTPWQNLVNVSLRQRLPEYRGNELALQVDVFNFLNLVNEEWGAQSFAGNNANVPLLGVAGMSDNAVATQRPTLTFNPTTERFNARNASSNYQIQLALRYSLF